MGTYFRRGDAGRFVATSAVQGAWNTSEQHIAPVLGLLAHVLKRDHAERHEHPMGITRISFDILGVLPIGTIEVATRVVRPGRTIELAEATLSHSGRPAVVARAWFTQDADTAAIAGSALPTLPAPDRVPEWDPTTIWPGEFVTTVEIRRDQDEPGRARFWARPRVRLLEGEPVSTTARMLALVDLANGMTPRVPPASTFFPNVELTAHVFRPPRDGWIGFDTTVSFGPHGHGLTHSILHDEDGPLGAVQQALTVRPRAAP